jgi:hypothetical protein
MQPGRLTLLALLFALAAGAASSPARGIETDQYYTWGKELEDSTETINAWVNLEIARALEEVNAQRSSRRWKCDKVAQHIKKRFGQWVIHNVEIWTTNTRLIDRIPGDVEEERHYRAHGLYSRHGPFDVGTWLPPSPTVKVHGVRTGTDKLSHFFSMGWWYYRSFRAELKDGGDFEAAYQRALRRGFLTEKSTLGMMASGVFSPADLESNYQGLRFYVRLCREDPPELVLGEEGWETVRPFDFREYVTPEWDESYNPNAFLKGRWKKVLPVALEYCELLKDPMVVAEREEYARRDGETVTELFLRERIAEGKLKDPAPFDLARVCAEAKEGKTPPSEARD